MDSGRSKSYIKDKLMCTTTFDLKTGYEIFISMTPSYLILGFGDPKGNAFLYYNERYDIKSNFDDKQRESIFNMLVSEDGETQLTGKGLVFSMLNVEEDEFIQKGLRRSKGKEG